MKASATAPLSVTSRGGTPTVFSTFLLRNLCVHDSICRHDELAFGCIPLVSALSTVGRQHTHSQNYATRSEGRISAVRSSLPILKKLFASDAIGVSYLR